MAVDCHHDVINLVPRVLTPLTATPGPMLAEKRLVSAGHVHTQILVLTKISIEGKVGSSLLRIRLVMGFYSRPPTSALRSMKFLS